MKTESRPKSIRKVYIDFLKICGIFMVMFNHTHTNGYMLFTVKQDSPFFIFYLFHSIFIRVAVPLFFMASGALLLEKKETVKHLIVHRFLRHLIILLIGSAVHYMYICYVSKPQPPAFSDFFTKLYTGNITDSYWFLYAYLAFILILPFLRRLANTMTDRDYLWMFVLFGLMKILSVFEFAVWKGSKSHNSYFSFFFVKEIVFYPLMGYYIDRIMKDRFFNAKSLTMLSIASIISILICCYLTIAKCKLTGIWKENSSQTYFNTLIFIPSITVFFCAKMMFMRHRPKEKICKLISGLSTTTFGIYLFEKIYRRSISEVYVFLRPYLTELPACWIWILCSFILGVSITFVLKLIPGIKKFI